MSGFTWNERFLVLTSQHDFAASDGYIYRNYVMDPVEWCAVFKVPGDMDQGIWRTLFPTQPGETDEDLLSDDGVTKEDQGLAAGHGPPCSAAQELVHCQSEGCGPLHDRPHLPCR